jgi:3-oxoacyl-[acyl-carrier protein] reductase
MQRELHHPRGFSPSIPRITRTVLDISKRRLAMTELAAKRALITGGSRGIGKAIALAYAKLGVRVALTYRQDEASAREAVAQIEAGGGSAVALQADVRDAASIAQMVDAANRSLGQIDILVNNAGVATPKPWQQLDADDWNATLATNLTSAFLVTQALAPGMVARGWGRLIMVSSVAAQLGGVIGPHYAASKAGMIGLAHGYAMLLAKTGVTSNAIAPALIETDMIAGNPNIRRDTIPVGRFGTADEVAQVAVLLAENGYLNGQTINVNGGWYMSS